MTDLERIMLELAEIRKGLATVSEELKQVQADRLTETDSIIQGVVRALAPMLTVGNTIPDDMQYLASLPPDERKAKLKEMRQDT